ncbi:MAG: serine/threonine-protein phosphatase [Candidatus Moduliflexus flocculans]|nr:serine/threonine-protein phosphatase [Candidatus Moduliflexus flocculans]
MSSRCWRTKKGLKQTTRVGPGPALGAVLGAAYDIRELKMEPGDMLSAYTDGLTDTANPQGEFFDKAELIPQLGPGKIPASPVGAFPAAGGGACGRGKTVRRHHHAGCTAQARMDFSKIGGGRLLLRSHEEKTGFP